MYQVRREAGRVIITQGTAEVFSAADAAYVVYESRDEGKKVARVKDLSDPDLLLALADAVFIRK